MILRIARLPISNERHGGVSVVLRAAQHSDVLRRVSNRRRVRLVDTVRVLEGGREMEHVRILSRWFNASGPARGAPKPAATRVARTVLDEIERELYRVRRTPGVRVRGEPGLPALPS